MCTSRKCRAAAACPQTRGPCARAVLKLVPDLLDVVLAVKDASYNEKPPHAAAIALAEARGFEVLANGGATPEPRACRGLWSV